MQVVWCIVLLEHVRSGGSQPLLASWFDSGVDWWAGAYDSVRVVVASATSVRTFQWSNQSTLFVKAFRCDQTAPHIQWSNRPTLFEQVFRHTSPPKLRCTFSGATNQRFSSGRFTTTKSRRIFRYPASVPFLLLRSRHVLRSSCGLWSKDLLYAQTFGWKT